MIKMAVSDVLRQYYQLTKPGIIYGNAMTAAAGFLLAAHGHIHFGLFLATLAGTSLTIAAACVFNNYIDRGLDAKMARTRRRALVTQAVSVPAALLYGTLLGLAGFAILLGYVNLLTAIVGAVAFIDYVVLYGITKRRTVHGTVVGSIAGAAAIVAGYTGAVDRFDGGAFILGIVLILWQMPHFYAIAIFRRDDYRQAGLPVLPVVYGLAATKRQIIIYIVGFILACAALTVFGYAGYSYLIIMTGLGLMWFYKGLKGIHAPDETAWARHMFFFSLVVVTGLSLSVALGSVLP